MIDRNLTPKYLARLRWRRWDYCTIILLIQRFDHLQPSKIVRRGIKITCSCAALRYAGAIYCNNTDTRWRSYSCLVTWQPNQGPLTIRFMLIPVTLKLPWIIVESNQAKHTTLPPPLTIPYYFTSLFLTSSFTVLSPLLSLSLFLGLVLFIPRCCAGPIATHCLTVGILQLSAAGYLQPA